MAYQGARAHAESDFDAYGAPLAEPRPAFEVLEGEGLDRQARSALDPRWRRVFAIFLAGLAIVSGLAVARVQLTVRCVEALSENTRLQVEVDEGEDLLRSLAVEESTLASAERIERIATQNLGMVYVGTGEPLAGPEEG